MATHATSFAAAAVLASAAAAMADTTTATSPPLASSALIEARASAAQHQVASLDGLRDGVIRMQSAECRMQCADEQF